MELLNAHLQLPASKLALAAEGNFKEKERQKDAPPHNNTVVRIVCLLKRLLVCALVLLMPANANIPDVS